MGIFSEDEMHNERVVESQHELSERQLADSAFEDELNARGQDDNTRRVLDAVPLRYLDGDMPDRVRTILMGMLNGLSMHESAGRVGFTEAEIMALAVVNEDVMAAITSTLRIMGLRSATMVSTLADRVAASPINVSGLRAAINAHQWVAQNTMPEVFSRSGARKERTAHLQQQEERAVRIGHDAIEIKTGVEV